MEKKGMGWKKGKMLALLLVFLTIMAGLPVKAKEREPYEPWEENVLTVDVGRERRTFYLNDCLEREDGMWTINYVSYLPQGGHYLLVFVIDFDALDACVDDLYGEQAMAADMVMFGEFDSDGERIEGYGAVGDKDIGRYAFGMEYVGADMANRHVRGEFYAELVLLGTFYDEKQVKLVVENGVFDFTQNGHHEKSEKTGAKAPASQPNSISNGIAADTAGANTFVGTVNGEPVVGYLDKTYVYIDHGKDYNAAFVTLDENGAPAYEIYIRIDENVSAGTYNGPGGSNHLNIGVYTKLGEKNLLWGDGYTLYDSSDYWTVELSGVEYSDDGVFEGEIEGTLAPSAYNDSPTYKEVPISGTFNFQMNTIHPAMESYRAEHSDYNAKQSYSYVQSIGTPSVSFSGNDTSSSTGSQSADHTCRTCKGSGSCTGCYGSGVKPNSNNNKIYDCPRCQGTGRCAVCYGTGSVY